MSLKEMIEAREREWFDPRAAFSSASRGREQAEPSCDYRTDYQRDRDRIIHSKAFRRLKHKTQVFLSPEGDHYRTRLTHALEVAQLSRTIARALRLNEDLTEAIALGHDLGHTPFGHCGEAELNAIHPGGFEHRLQSLRVVEYLEKRKPDLPGMNLTWEVRDGILNHSGPNRAATLEGQIVSLCDRIGYINHDIDDAIRAGVLTREALPKYFTDYFGHSHSQRIDHMITNVIDNSVQGDVIRMSEDAWEILLQMRRHMFERVYLNPEAKAEEAKARQVVQYLYQHFRKAPHELPDSYYQDFLAEGDGAIKDFIAGMTDRYAVNLFRQMVVPNYWQMF